VIFTDKGAEIVLSGHTLAELLQAVMNRGARFRFQTRGFSMSPFVKNNDIVTIVPLHTSSPRLGEVVAIIHPETGRLIVHRIIGKKGEDYLIKGDNTPDADGLIAASNILGRVKKVERNNRNVFLGLGPERLLISFLTRWRFLPLLRPVWRFVHPAFRRLIT